MYTLVLGVCAVVCTSGENLGIVTASPSPRVGVPVAGAFHGAWMETRRGRTLQAYRGIRYARAPVGTLRFQPPQPILQYSSPVDAAADGPRCPQPLPAGRLVDEDCLIVNVYTPYNCRSVTQPILQYSSPVDAAADGPRCPQPLSAGRLVDEDCLIVNVYTPYNCRSVTQPILQYSSPVDAAADGPRCPQPLSAGRLVDEDCLIVNVYTPYNCRSVTQPILQYSSPVDAAADGPRCPQPLSAGRLVDEDCLIVNVYTPYNCSTTPLPVVVYMHAGGFYSMTSRSDVAGPEYLLDRDLVLVTFNYRIGSLGFLALGTKDAPGNNGFKDQVAALKWVQRNIATFGGDPDLVTISGCSAGSLSVMLHMISPMSKGLFHRAISMSGSPTAKVPAPPHQLDLAVKQAQISNCSTASPRDIYNCLKTKNWREIAGSMKGFFEFGFDPLSLWRPVVEPDFGQERFLAEDPMAAITAGRLHAVPFIISQTRDEFFWKAFSVLKNSTLISSMNQHWDRIAPISFILPRENSSAAVHKLKDAYFKDLDGHVLKDDQQSADALGKLYGDAITGFPVHRMANLMCRHSTQPVWYYEFSYRGNHSHYEDPTTKKPVGVAHHDDLIYLFTLKYRLEPLDVADTPDSKMVDKMTGIWYNFARYGDPNPRHNDTPELSTLSWPAMRPEDRKYLQLGNSFLVKSQLFEDRFRVWDEIYPIQY